MWTVIGTLLTTALPLLLKLINYIVDKKSEDQKLKDDMLRLIVRMEGENIPVKLSDKYNEQLVRLRKQLEEEDRGGSKVTN